VKTTWKLEEDRMAQFVGVDHAMYAHSQVHAAVAQRDHAALRRILSTLPQPVRPGEVSTESQSLEAEQQADDVSKVIDRRDVPGRETPLHVAVRLGDGDAVEMLMSAGADWSLQNEQGWSALQEAVCAREEEIAVIITRHYQPMAWAKWCRRLPRLAATMQRMRDFYMEITFHFESSVIPFIGRIAPSDTYRIWKRGSNLRADMTLAGFDGFRIHRSDQSFLFLGNGSEDGKLAPGTLCVLTHKDKEVSNALEGAGVQPSEAEIMQEVTAMSRTNMYRPGDHPVHIARENSAPISKSQLDIHLCSVLHIKEFPEKLKLDNSLAQDLNFDLTLEDRSCFIESEGQLLNIGFAQ
jgi:hypothetical protein